MIDHISTAYDYLQNPDILGMSAEDIHSFERRGYNADVLAELVTQCYTKNLTLDQTWNEIKAQFPEMFSTTTPSDFTDVGNAEIVERRNRGKMLFCDALGWLVYDDASGVWVADEHAARGKCIEFTDVMLDHAKTLYDEEFQKALQDHSTTKIQISKETVAFYKHAINSRARHAIDNMLSLCKPAMHVKAKALDANPFDLNTPAGLVDLRTGEIRPHDPKALCTHQTNCAPSSEGLSLWLDFVDLITCGDKDLAKFLQLNAGMSAIGQVTSEYAVFAIGCGRNGKSTYYGALSNVLGDYSGAIDSDALIADGKDRRFAFAGIRGKRLVTCGELEEGRKLSTKALKFISSSTDKMLLQQKYKDEEEIDRTFHLTLFTNFLPKVNATDDGTWRRIEVIPFNATMPTGENEIKDYADFLATNAGGAILRWIIDGAVELCKSRFNIELFRPDAVTRATQQYRESESWINGFLDDCFEVRRDGTVRAGDLQKMWGIYSRMNGIPSRSRAELTQAMENKGFTKQTGGQNKTYWYGLELLEEMRELLEKNK